MDNAGRIQFQQGKTGGAILSEPADKTRITIRIDDDILDWFRKQIEVAGHGSYQTMMNAALREYMRRQREPLEAILRRVVREELAVYNAGGQKRDE